MNQSVQAIFRIIEEWWERQQRAGLPAAMLRDQVPSAAIPPATSTDKGGVILSDSTPAATGTAAAGTATPVSRRDHVHALGSHDHTAASGDGGTLTNDTHDGYAEYTEISAPSTPGANKVRLYAKDKSGVSTLYYKDDGGTVYDLSAVGGGLVDQGTATYLDFTNASAPSTPASGKTRIYTKADKAFYQKDDAGAETALAGGGGGTEGHILIVDTKTAGTAGGTFTLGAWRTRDLNTIRYDTGSSASLSANQITLAAGTYRCRIECPAWLINQNQARLYDITNSAVLLVGSNAYATRAGADMPMTISTIVGRFTLSGSTVIEVQHQSQNTQATNGFGLPMNGAFTVTEEIYTICELWKE